MFFYLVYWYVLVASLGAFSISKLHIFNPSKTYIKYKLFKHLTK